MKGFTMIEVLAVVVIIGIMAAVLVPSVVNHMNKAKYTLAKADISTLDGALQMFLIDQGRLPRALGALVQKPPDVEHYPEDGYLGALRIIPADPWGNQYVYRVPGHDGRRYMLATFARDGKEGGEGWDEDLDCWRIRERR